MKQSFHDFESTLSWKTWMIEQNFAGTIRAVEIKHRWFSGRIVASHAIDPVSIPGRCKTTKQKILPEKRKLKCFHFLLFHCQKRGKTKYSAELKTSIRLKQSFHDFVQSFGWKNWIEEQNFVQTIKIMKNKHRWFSGRIVASQAIDPGPISGRYIAEKISEERAVWIFFSLSLFHCQKRGNLLKWKLYFKTQMNWIVHDFDSKYC